MRKMKCLSPAAALMAASATLAQAADDSNNYINCTAGNYVSSHPETGHEAGAPHSMCSDLQKHYGDISIGVLFCSDEEPVLFEGEIKSRRRANSMCKQIEFENLFARLREVLTNAGNTCVFKDEEDSESNAYNDLTESISIVQEGFGFYCFRDGCGRYEGEEDAEKLTKLMEEAIMQCQGVS